jgi:SAM-dependent methyltransferase
MERDQAAALNDGRPAVPDPSEADRIRAIYRSYDALQVQEGDILPFQDRSAQLVVLSTVLSSVLDPGTRRQVAAESYRIVSDGGMLLIYDIRLPSPANPNVCRIGKRELRALLPTARIRSYPITLLPPVARSLCRRWPGLYRPLARIRPLRSHYLSVVTRPTT